MKKETVISITFLALGLIFEGLYFADIDIFFKAKFWLLGAVFILIGTIGLVLHTFLPMLDGEKNGK